MRRIYIFFMKVLMQCECPTSDLRDVSLAFLLIVS